MALTVKFAFDIGEQVRVQPLELDGVVLARCDRGAGFRDYRIVWWSDGTRKDEWLLEHELCSSLASK